MDSLSAAAIAYADRIGPNDSPALRARIATAYVAGAMEQAETVALQVIRTATNQSLAAGVSEANP